MEEKKENQKISILLYLDWLDSLELLRPAERGVIFTNLLRQAAQLPLEKMNRGTQVLFSAMMRQVSRDLEKWQEVKRARAEAGRKGGVASGESRRRQKEANEAKEAVDVPEAVPEFVPEPVPAPGSPYRENPGAGENREDSLISFYRQNIEAEPNPRVLAQLQAYRQELGDALCRKAIEIGGENAAVSWNYVRTVLEGMKSRGIYSVDQLRRKPPRVGKQFITNEPRELSELEKWAVAQALAGIDEPDPFSPVFPDPEGKEADGPGATQ